MNSQKFPSIENQGFTTFKISNIEFTTRKSLKNACIEKFEDDTYMLVSGDYPNSQKIELCILNKNFEVVKSKILDLPISYLDFAEDVKLIKHGNEIYCAYTEFNNHNQRLCVLNMKFDVIREIPLYYGVNHVVKLWEKNWNFFFHDNKLYFIFSIDNHIVVEIDPQNEKY